MKQLMRVPETTSMKPDMGQRGATELPLPIIVQYWHESPPIEIRDLMGTWERAAGEGFEYHSFDDASARQFIRLHYDRRTEEAFLSCAVPAMRADFFRICALLVRPGIYVDADTRRTGVTTGFRFRSEQSAPLLPLYHRLQRGLLFQRETRVSNAFMIVKRAPDPLLHAILSRVIDNIEARASNNVFFVTGPGVITKLKNQFGMEHEYFRDFDLWTADDLLPYMRLVGKLPYKQTEDHWLNAQKVRSIFADRSTAKNRGE